jgi:putative ABC transport system ATP-binding protein
VGKKTGEAAGAPGGGGEFKELSVDLDKPGGPDAGEGPGRGGRPLLRFSDVVKTRPGGQGYRLSVDSFRAFRGERLALIGESGSGKSTFLDMVAMILKPDLAAEMAFLPSGGPGWLDLWALWRGGGNGKFEALRRSELGYVMQTGGLLPFLTAADNIVLPARLKRGFPKSEIKDRLMFLAGRLGITHLLGKSPARISVGERQRCAVARALIHDPVMVLADEPTASLDPPTADRIFELLLELCEGRTLLVSTHERWRVAGDNFLVWEIVCEKGGESDPIEAALVRAGPGPPGTAPPRTGPPTAGRGRPTAAAEDGGGLTGPTLFG